MKEYKEIMIIELFLYYLYLLKVDPNHFYNHSQKLYFILTLHEFSFSFRVHF